MPGLDGLETAKRIRGEISAHIPIIILTAYDRSDIEESGDAAAVDEFMAKPFFLTSFRHKLESVINRGQNAENAEEAREESVLEGMHILAAEDNEINAEILSELLSMVGATCKICENGQIAAEEFERSEQGEYDLILMDIQMPVMNGYEAARTIRALDHPHARIIPIITRLRKMFAMRLNRE